MKKFISLFFVIICSQMFGQLVGINTQNPVANLDVRVIDPSQPTSASGISLPHVNVLPSTGNIAGQMLYHSTNRSFYIYDGGQWVKYADFGKMDVIGDLKTSFQEDDHDGWFRLDGRSLNILSEQQLKNAMALGMTVNLVDMTEKVFKMSTTTPVLLSEGGNQKSIQLRKENLPVDTKFSGVAQASGSHRHSAIGGGIPSSTRAANTFSGRGTNKRARVRQNNARKTSVDTHSHDITVNSGGSGAPLQLNVKNVDANKFIFLGID